MKKLEVDTSEDPIRLFKSDFFEFFTHISPITVLVIWLPVVGFFVYRSLTEPGGSAFIFLGGLLLGLFLWTLAEYTLHRFLFHFPAKTPWQKKISFLIHGIHHKQPKVKTRLVMPPALSMPLAALFYGIYFLIFESLLSIPLWLDPVFAGFILGYVAYDMTHYSTHHIPMKKGYLRLVRVQHMHHHFQTPNQRFGVTSPLWDHVFGTMPFKS